MGLDQVPHVALLPTGQDLQTRQKKAKNGEISGSVQLQ